MLIPTLPHLRKGNSLLNFGNSIKVYVQGPNVSIMNPTNSHYHCQPELPRHSSEAVIPDLSIVASRVTALLWVTQQIPWGFSVLHKPKTDDAQNAPSASPLFASVPGMRFSTQVWWPCRDADWVQADMRSPVQTVKNTVNEQSRELYETQTSGYCLATAEESEQVSQSSWFTVRFRLVHRRDTKFMYSTQQTGAAFLVMWERQQISLPTCHTATTSCSVEEKTALICLKFSWTWAKIPLHQHVH